jgi:hypothetical protein
MVTLQDYNKLKAQEDFDKLEETDKPAVKVEEVKEENDIHVAYEEKFGKTVPNNKKNDKEWIEKKLSE